MVQGYYGKEPFDLRLTVLRMIYKLPVIAAVTLAGTLVFGGMYYVKNVLLRSERLYAATSTFRIEYDVEEEKDVSLVCINEVSWDAYAKTELLLDAVQFHLVEENASEGGKEGMDNRELAEALSTDLASDVRVLSVTAVTDSPEKSVRIARAVEAAMTQEFAEAIREIRAIRVIDQDDTAQEVIPDVRVGRAFVLSAVLSCFFVLVFLLLKELGDDSIWLPSVIGKRYGLKAVGTIESKGLAENIKYFFREDCSESSAAMVAVCAVQENVDASQVLEKLRQTCPDEVGAGWFAVPSPIANPEVCERLRGADGILLAVEAGCHAGLKLEYLLEYLTQQDCAGQKVCRPMIAAVLWNADERLIRKYYGFEWKRKEDV